MTDRPSGSLRSKVKATSGPTRDVPGCATFKKLFKTATFAAGVRNVVGRLSSWQQEAGRRWRVFSTETNFPYAIGLLAACLVIIALWGSFAPSSHYDLRVEFWGLTFDVVFILIIFSFFEHRRQRVQRIQIQHEIIEDYKRWNSEEARFRLAGAIRRLNKNGVFAINLSGARLSDFSFSKNNIGRLEGSTFFDGNWGGPLADGSVELNNVSFDNVDCRSVQFSPFDPLEVFAIKAARYARFVNCSFGSADLGGAIFNGASLVWTDPPPESHYEFDEDPETGQAWSMQVTYGPFDGAELAGASFVRAVFENADFRGAEGILKADFTGASGLETAIFDDEETKLAVMSQATAKEMP